MPEINSVWFVDDNILEIWLDNGHRIWLSVTAMSRDPRLSALIKEDDDSFRKPQTDGRRVYWQDGANLTFNEIMEIVESRADKGEGGLPKIVRVEPDEYYPTEVLVELDNGNYLNLDFAAKQSEPLFAEFKERSLPKTDGTRIYWLGGLSITIEEVMKLLKSP